MSSTRHTEVDREVYEATRANFDTVIHQIADGGPETDVAIVQMFVLGALTIRAAFPDLYAMLESGFAPYVDELVGGTGEP